MVNTEEIKAICERHDVYLRDEKSDPSDRSIALVESITLCPEAIPLSFQGEHDHGLPVVPSLSVAELSEKQHADPSIREIITHMQTGESPPPLVRTELPEFVFLLRERKKLELIDGVLYRKRQSANTSTYQLVLPRELRELVLKSLHDEMGHLGVERTLDLARDRFYWPKMSSTVEEKIRACDRCVRRKTPVERAAPMVNIRTSRPLELVCMDFLSVEPDRSNTKDILVITDHFTKYALAIPTPNQKATTVAKCLWDHFIVHYGFPEKLHSDQGPDFESRTIKELCVMAGIKKTRTTPYHPKGNPVERFNRTLLQMLGTLDNKDKSHWRDYVKPLAHAYNCTKHEVTGFSPYELMFGRKPRLPVDLAFELPVNDQSMSHSQYVQNLKDSLKESYALCNKNAQKSAERNKLRFDKRVTESSLEPGDRVLVRNVRLRGKHKLADRWEAEVYVVVSRAGDLPVYRVCPERKKGPLRTLHRDLLLPCRFLPVSVPESSTPPPVTKKPRTRQNPGSENENEECEQSDDDESYPLRYVPVESPACSTIPRVDEAVDDVITKDGTAELAAAPPEPCSTDSERLVPQEVAEEALITKPSDPGTSDPKMLERHSFLRKEIPPVSSRCPDGEVEMLTPDNTDHTPHNDTQLDMTHSDESSGEVQRAVRCSNRLRTGPKRLHYAELGNPLIEVVQSLFQSLSDALVNSLNGVDSRVDDQISTTPGVPVITQPLRRSTGTCLPSQGEGVTQVI
ncbi:uncharacterized protein LOC133457765 [Cololabis saira]|uniref:uncharacterized protein LOC133457765 n=1 Tax=Cololabis saira TaxID=129043 RepID=UPI002AD2B128|nr:uncharacterized protein LOC133457765 [Cololabis saira]XP_061593077.1 uncharacterized protein LOC133457765 [Cololabis saira]